jgi:hypothetical protein
MPRIPKYNLGKVIPKSTTFPDPMWRRVERRGANGWEQLDPEEQITIRAGWPVTHHHVTSYGQPSYSIDENWVPVQGPDLPRNLERRRQFIRNAQEAYEAELAEERARQAYNRRVAAWNEYADMSPEERKFWANRGKLEDAMMDYELDMDPSWYTKNYENFTYLPSRPIPDYSSATRRSINIHDYPSYDDFDEFPDELSDAPWRMW